MMPIDPPDDYVESLQTLARIPKKQFVAMHSVIQERPQVANAAVLALDIEAAVGLKDADTLLEALMSLTTYVDTMGEAPETVFEGVALSQKLALPPARQVTLKQRLIELLDDGPLYILQKGWSLALEHDLLFLSSRIITDIRPIFGKQIESFPPAAVLHHMLRITYRHDNAQESHTYALDDQDLRTLRDDIDRALKKASAVGNVFDGARANEGEG